MLAQMNCAIPYRKIMEIEIGMPSAVGLRQQMHSLAEVCLPSWLVKDIFVCFAIDNIDSLE